MYCMYVTITDSGITTDIEVIISSSYQVSRSVIMGVYQFKQVMH